jgi:phosphoribosylglycinamide formyltransferase
MMPKTKITILISGNGSNLQALIDDADRKLIDTSIVRVISNRKSAYGLTRASKANIPTSYHNLLNYKRKYEGQDDQRAREEYDADLAELILKDEPELVVCAGFMHVLSPRFLEPLERKRVAIINLHPGLCFDACLEVVVMLM